MSAVEQHRPRIRDADVPLDRDGFFRELIRTLAGTLEDTVGLGNAEGYLSVVGGHIGQQLDAAYREALGEVEEMSPDQLAEVLVDLKRRIAGDFYVIEADATRIVLGNRRCPFGDKVAGRSSLCMMTSNVFGAIAAENFGYAKVELQETIAQGDPGCHVVVHMDPTAADAEGREYFATGRRA